MIEVDTQGGGIRVGSRRRDRKSRRSGMYTVLMPKSLAAHLDAARVPGENMSDVILRLAKEAETPAKPDPSR